MDTLISIIVPVYNIEAYIARCLDSLLAQSFTDIEIVVIDDGSTDQSGRACDRYAARDPRFRVYHTANRGLSAARNYGIDHSKGEWIMFLDGDDAACPDFCRIPYETAMAYQADLVIFQRIKIKPNGKEYRNAKEVPTGIISREEAIDYGRRAAWNKLYRRELFDGIRYPEGCVFEDTATTHLLVYKAQRIAMTADRLIRYYYRKDSITHTVSARDTRQFFRFSIQRYHDLTGYGYPEEKAYKSLQKAAFQYCIWAEPGKDELFSYAEHLVHDIDGSIGFTPKKRFLLVVWKMNRKMFHFICRQFGKKRSDR